MKKKIFYNKPFEKAIGNLLFHYNFIFQLSKKYDLEPIIVDNVDFLKISKSKSQITFLEKVNFEKSYINRNFIIDDPLFNSIDVVLNTNFIKLKPPFLGEVFFDNLFFDPNLFFSVKKLEYECDINITAHFRGGDFASWNTSALLPFAYYKNCLDDVLKDTNSNDKILLKIISDDYKLSALSEFLVYSKKFNNISVLIDQHADYVQDFQKICNSDILFCTPSTFCIWASFLGSEKVIYHSKDWVTERASLNDIFWVRINSGNTPYNIKLI